MRVNIYSEEISEDIEIIEKEVGGKVFTGLRMYMYLPVTTPVKEGDDILGYTQHRGKFMHHPNDDDSSAVTFWGGDDLRATLKKALDALDAHYADSQ